MIPPEPRQPEPRHEDTVQTEMQHDDNLESTEAGTQAPCDLGHHLPVGFKFRECAGKVP